MSDDVALLLVIDTHYADTKQTGNPDEYRAKMLGDAAFTGRALAMLHSGHCPDWVSIQIAGLTMVWSGV